jgi:hypothetical protein
LQEIELESIYMSSVNEILAAAASLDPDQFVVLREELDRLEEQLWQDELTKTTAELRDAAITDEEIDRLVMRRRREGRS